MIEKKRNLRWKPISRPFVWCNALQQMIHEAHLPRGKLIKISPELIGALITALKLVNSGGVFISFTLGKCASWIICRNALHHTKGLEIGFHRRFLFFIHHDNNLVYSLPKLNVIIFVNIHSILFLKRHTDRKSWNLAPLQVSF